MKRLLMLNLIPILVADIFVWMLSISDYDADKALGIGIYVIAAQYFIVMPLYYVATLSICHFKYGLGVLKGFALQLIVLLCSMPVFFIISSLFYYVSEGEFLYTFTDMLKILADIPVDFNFICTYILPALAIMLPGTVIIAVVSFVRKRNTEKS